MTITYGDLSEVDLGTLGAAVTDWKSTADGLKTLAESARDGMLAKSDTARWAGANATVTRGFVAETAKEIADLHTEASSIHRLLDDAHTELTALQKRIRTAGEVDAPNLGIKIEDLGDGRVRCFYPHTRGDTDERTQDQLDARQELEDRINRILAHATEIDTSVNRALATTHGNDAHNAGHSSYTSLDAAQADRAAELAARGPELTDAQFAELNSIMTFNARDADFSTAFYTSLGGPKESLEFYGRMTLDGTAGADKERLALTQRLQKNLGIALASATDPDNKPHLPASWGTEFRRLGTREIVLRPGAGSSPYGYQVLGGLLRYGTYDPRFLTPIAEHITQLHHDDPHRFTQNKPMLMDPDNNRGFNPSGGTGVGYDPLNSVLEALGHSPDAAKQFFSDPPTVYNEDGTVDKNGTLGYKYFDEFTKPDFDWSYDTLGRPGSDEAKAAAGHGPEALGHALEAAVTGDAWDANPPQLHRDEQSQAIMKEVILRYNVANEDGPPESMKGSLARMGATYIDDLNYSIKDFGGSGDALDRSALFARSSDGSTRVSFGELEARNFMMLIAGDEDGYKTLTTAQQIHMASGLTAFEGDRDKGVAFAQNAAKVHGILDEARSHGIREEFKEAEEAGQMQREQEAEWRKALLDGGITVAVTAGAAVLVGPAAGVVAATAVPLVLETGGAALSTAYSNHTMDYLKDNEYKNDTEALGAVQELERVGEWATVQPALRYAQNAGGIEMNDFVDDIEQSYRAGKDAVSSNEKVG
nr:DUF6571 family protein [Streptomyces sp. ST1020]